MNDYQDVRKGYDEYSKHKWGIFWKVLGVVVFLAVAVIIGKIVLFPAKVMNTAINSAGQVIKKTLDADNVIYNYEWFKNKSNSLVAAEQRIKITEESLTEFKKDAGHRESWTFEDKGQYNRHVTDLRGQKAYFEQLKAEYRAACLKINRSIFKGDDKIINWADKLTGVN